MNRTCLKCGTIVEDEAVDFCPSCGNKLGEQGHKSGLLTAAYILMIITCVALGWMIVPLAWLIPMTIAIKKRQQSGEPLGTGFKVCILLFANLVSGILLLCDPEA